MNPKHHLYKAIAKDLETLIESKTYLPGEKLPSVRTLSRKWGVSLGTVQTAFAQLEAKGLIFAKPQSGFRVNPKPIYSLPEPQTHGIKSFEDPGEGHLSPSLVESLVFNPDSIPFGIATLDPKLFPVSELHRSLKRVSRSAGPKGLVYDFVPGLLKLRQQISKLSVLAGARLAPDEFVLTNGAIEAFHVCLRAVAQPGDLVIVESPGYYGFFRALRNMQMRPLEIPAHPREGMDLNVLQTTLRKHRVSAIMTVSNFSNPLGCSIPDDRKKDLARMARQHDVPIIENDIFGDLSHTGERPGTCKAHDKSGMVLLCSSFSKTLSPGHRIGWTAPGRFKSRVEWLIHESTFASSTLMRHAIAEYLSTANYQKHLSRLQQSCALQVQQMSLEVSKYFPTGTRLSRPEGGFILWVEFPEKVNSVKLHQQALKNKISITPGSVFSTSKRYQNCIRLSCGHPMSPALEHAIAVLGRLAKKMIDG